MLNKAEGDKVLDRLVKVTADVMKGAHDSDMAVVDNHAYKINI